MAGVQTRGRNRDTTNKIEQIKTQNKVSPTPTPATPQEKSTYQNKIAHGQQSHKSQNQIKSTESSIAQATIISKAQYVPQKKELSPIERLGLGAQNQVTDYQGLVNWDHKSESVLNQSIEKAFEGDWDGAGKLIQNNPYRFAGNLAVEVGSALIPATWGLKAVKYGAQAAKAASKAKHAKKAQEALNTLPTVKKTPKNYVYAKADSGGDYVRVTDVENPEHIGGILAKENSAVLEKFNIVKQISTDTGENVISIIPKKFLGTSNNEIFDKSTQGIMGFIQPSRLSTSTKAFKPEILSKSESLGVLKGLRTEMKVKKRTKLRSDTLLARNATREPSMTGHPSTSRWRRQILTNQVKAKLAGLSSKSIKGDTVYTKNPNEDWVTGSKWSDSPIKASDETGAPVFRFAEEPNAKAFVNILEPDTVNFSKFSSGTTWKDSVNTLKHEDIHQALRAAGPGTLKSNKNYVETSRMQASLDPLSYMSNKSNQKGVASILNKESYTVAEVKKMSPDKLDLLMREQRALGNTDKFIPGKQFNWKKSSAPEIRRTSKYDGNSHLLGIDDTFGIETVVDPGSGKLVDARTLSNLSPEANYKVLTSYPESPLYQEYDFALPIKRGTVRPLASEIDYVNRARNKLKTEKYPPKEKRDWVGDGIDVAKDTALPFGIMTAKGSQYYNQVKKNRYQKNKAKTQSFGGYGQFF